MGTELFKTLREQHGDNFENFIFKKVVPVVGDIAADQNLGIDIESKREHLWEILDAIVNNAACTVFDGRFVEFQASRSTCLLNVQHNFNQTLLAVRIND
jgi:fatty acyl-CoA reductase